MRRVLVRNALRALLVLAMAFPATVLADPPPWAPAHGYRAKGKHKGHAYTVPFGIAQGTCYRELVGSVLGGAAGGALGSQVGKGSGKTAAVVGGTILGVIVGGAIGRSMDRIDQACVGQILEHAPDRSRIRWMNHDDGRGEYAVLPQRTYQDRAGRYCREYTATATVDGRTQEVYGTACRQPDGTWQIIG